MENLKSVLESTSNDFSTLDKSFVMATGASLDGHGAYTGAMFAPVTIIVPYYRDGEKILRTLDAIDQQDLSAAEMRQVEVLLVDDGSNDDVEGLLAQHHFSFDLRVITRRENRGRCFTRNEGFRAARHEILILIDSDILLARNFVREHVVRNILCPGNMFVGLINNIDGFSSMESLLNAGSGLPVPARYNEYRIEEELAAGQQGIWVQTKDEVIHPLADTRNFRDLGNGRRVGFYDTACMVSTCSMSLTRDLYRRIGGFSSEFKGWGLEDTFFGACGIAEGAKVVPVLATGAYHLNHAPRSGNEAAKAAEFAYNIAKYKELLTQPLMPAVERWAA